MTTSKIHPIVNTDSALTQLVSRIEAQANGELGSMFAAYKVAAKLDKNGRDKLVDQAVDQALAGDDDKRVSNVKNRTRQFFGASRHFAAEPKTLDGHIFAEGNKRSVTESALKQALDTARKSAVDRVEHAKVSDLKSSSGERYAWASTLNAAESDTAANLLTVDGLADFFAHRLAPNVAARLAAEQAQALAIEKAAAEKAAAAALVVERTPEPAPKATEQAPAEQATKPAAEQAPAEQATKPAAEQATKPAAEQAQPVPAGTAPTMSAKVDQSAVVDEMPKAPAAMRNLFKKLSMHCLTHGVTVKELQTLLGEVSKAHDTKAHADKQAEAKAKAATAAPSEIVSAILG